MPALDLDQKNLPEATAEEIERGNRSFALARQRGADEEFVEISEDEMRKLLDAWRRLGRTLRSEEAEAIIGHPLVQKIQLDK